MIKQGIKTYVLPPTDTKGKRIVAVSAGGTRKVYSWDYSRETEGNHYAAAVALCEHLGWSTDLRCAAFDGPKYWAQADSEF